LFLFTALLLQTNPDGIASHNVVFSVVVGTLTTSIVAVTVLLFIRTFFKNTLHALYGVDDDGHAAEEELAEDASHRGGGGYASDSGDSANWGETSLALGPAPSGKLPRSSAAQAHDAAAQNGAAQEALLDEEDAPPGEHAAPPDADEPAAAAPEQQPLAAASPPVSPQAAATPPAPSWVARLTTRTLGAGPGAGTGGDAGGGGDG
jgi:hypothetical protein